MQSKRWIGGLYTISGILGLLIGLVGLLVLWGTRPTVTHDINATVTLLGRSLAATEDTIAVVDTSIQEANIDLDMVQKMMSQMSDSLDSSRVMIDTTADLVGGQMVDFVDNTRTSLTAVQTSANVVDNMLRTITGIPLIGPWLGGQRYNPPVPLGDSVANVKKSMDPLPDTLTGIQKDLKTSSGNVATIKGQIDALSQQVDGIRSSIADTQNVVNEYHDVLSVVETRFKLFEKQLPLAINTIYILLTLLLLWVVLSQAGMLLHGLDLLGILIINPRKE